MAGDKIGLAICLAGLEQKNCFFYKWSIFWTRDKELCCPLQVLSMTEVMNPAALQCVNTQQSSLFELTKQNIWKTDTCSYISPNNTPELIIYNFLVLFADLI